MPAGQSNCTFTLRMTPWPEFLTVPTIWIGCPTSTDVGSQRQETSSLPRSTVTAHAHCETEAPCPDDDDHWSVCSPTAVVMNRTTFCAVLPGPTSPSESGNAVPSATCR